MALNKVLIELSVMAEIIKYDLSVPDRETAGLLLGKHFNGIVYIDEMDVGEQQGNIVHVEISDEALTNAVIKVSSRDDGHVIVGWWHSHPGHTSFMSDTDKSTQSRYQKLFEDAVAIVVDASRYERDFRLANLDFGVYHIEGGQIVRLPYGIVRDHTETMTLEEELAYKITGRSLPRKVKHVANPAPLKVTRKVMTLDDIRELRRRLEDLKDDFPFQDFPMVKSVIDINEAIAHGVEADIPIDIDKIMTEVQKSAKTIEDKLDLIEHYKRESQQAKALGFTLLAIVLEIGIILSPTILKFFT